MHLRHQFLSTGLVSLVLMFSVSLALSAPATATIALNVRNGPGGEYLVLDTLEAGERVDASGCANGWCYIVQTGPDGWAAQNYLRFGPPQRPGLTGQQPLALPEQPGFSWPAPAEPLPGLVLPDQTPAPAAGFSWPLQPAPSPAASPAPFVFPSEPSPATSPAPLVFPLAPAPSPALAPALAPSPYRACFFDGEGFSGEAKCVTSPRSFSRLGPAWNNRISSLKVQIGAQVTLCNRADFKGLCRSFGANVDELPPRLNNQVSSGRVF